MSEQDDTGQLDRDSVAPLDADNSLPIINPGTSHSSSSSSSPEDGDGGPLDREQVSDFEKTLGRILSA